MAYSEPYDKMDSKTLDISKAITSLREELEAVDWYNQRVVTATDEELKRIMAHNRDEEKEHAAMRRHWCHGVSVVALQSLTHEQRTHPNARMT